MNIGIDIDGTINNFQDVVIKILAMEYDIHIHKSQYEIYDKLTPQQQNDFFYHNDDFLLHSVSVLPYAQSVIKDLLLLNNNVYLITARKYNCVENTLQWLRMHKIPYTDIYFNTENKVDVCKWKNITYMIDDNPYVLDELINHNIPSIVFQHEYNQHINNYAFKSNDWKNIFNFITS